MNANCRVQNAKVKINEASPQTNKIKKQRIEIKDVSGNGHRPHRAAKRAKKSRGPELSVLSSRLCGFA
jgi:hypothetical protein